MLLRDPAPHLRSSLVRVADLSQHREESPESHRQSPTSVPGLGLLFRRIPKRAIREVVVHQVGHLLGNGGILLAVPLLRDGKVARDRLSHIVVALTGQGAPSQTVDDPTEVEVDTEVEVEVGVGDAVEVEAAVLVPPLLAIAASAQSSLVHIHHAQSPDAQTTPTTPYDLKPAFQVNYTTLPPATFPVLGPNADANGRSARKPKRQTPCGKHIAVLPASIL